MIKKKIDWRLIRSVLGSHPSLENKVTHLYYNVWKLKMKYRSYKLGLDVNKMYLIDPQKITFVYSLRNFNRMNDRGKIITGNWDILDSKFENLYWYKGFKERIIDGKDWANTDFYNYVLSRIKRNEEFRKDSRKSFWKYRSKADWDERIKRMESLYQDIKKNGYKANKEIYLGANVIKAEDEITVNIGRKGDLLFNDGLHRLCIAKLLKLRKIPVKIVVRHPNWVDFRSQLISFTESPGATLYDSLTHPDLQNTPSLYGEYRFEVINRNVNTRRGTLLNIGARLGYFCHKFEELGFTCYAAEDDTRYLYLLKKLKRAENRTFKIIPTSILEYKKGEKLKFDVVVALNVFHHFIKRKASYENLINLLERLVMKELYFQTHNPHEHHLKGGYRNYDPDDFVDFILKNSCLTESQMIGMTKDKRPLYKIFNKNRILKDDS